MSAAWPIERVLREIFEAPRRGFEPVLDSVVIEQSGWWQLITPSFQNGWLNEVALSALPGEQADAMIDATLADYARLGLQFRWTVGPESAPSDLALRLTQRGLVQHPTLGMAAELANLELGSPSPPGVDARVAAREQNSVEQVGASNEAEFTSVMAAGWRTDVAPLARYHRALLAAPRSRTYLFLARLDGQPAGAAAYVGLDDSAFLMGGVVLPAFRGRGLYRALVRARLQHAAERGISLATAHAGRLSAPILSRLGFQSVCRFAIFTSS